MGMMQSCYWRDEELEIKPAAESHSSGDRILITAAQVGHLGGPLFSERPAEMVQIHSKGDRLTTQDAEKSPAVWDESYQQRPLQTRCRHRHQQGKIPVGPKRENDEAEENPIRDPVQIHGWSVQRYREIYHSVVTPAALSALPTNDPSEYMTEVLELKQRLWVAVYKPQLQERVRRDGSVHVTEIFDLT